MSEALRVGLLIGLSIGTFLGVALTLGFIKAWDGSPPSGCNGDCNQGRNCNCK